MSKSLALSFVSSLLVVLVLSCTSALAQPRTMYKPDDIENARRNIERYEWAQKRVRGREKAAEFAMQQDRQFFVELIPELTPGTSYHSGCPACFNPDHPILRRRPGNMTWTVEDPDRITCTDCDTVFPNEDYPETGRLELPRMGQVIAYYQTPEERALPDDATDEERAQYAMLGVSNVPTLNSPSSLIRFYRARWAWEQALRLAKLYAITEDVAYAERTLWILDRFAEVFPNYLYKSYHGPFADWPPAKVAASMGDINTPPGGRFPPDAIVHAYAGAPEIARRIYGTDEQGDYSTLSNGFWGAGRLTPHGKGSDSGPLLNMTIAYDLVRDARYPDGTPVADEQMHRRIIEDLIDAGANDYDHWDDLSNKGIATRSLSAAVGIVLEQPERVRRAVDGFNEILETRYHFDGFYSESPGYSAHNYSNMRELPDLLYGYSDPPGYQPEEGARIDDFNPYEHGHFHRALLSKVRQIAPPGNQFPIIGNVSHHRRVIQPLFLEVLAARLGGPYGDLLETVQDVSLAEWGTEYALWYRDPDLRAEGIGELPLRSEWFPGWHVAVLRGDDEDNNTALYLVGDEHRWTLHTGHRHSDTLNLTYYAFGEELVSDRGYFSGSAHRTPDGRLGQSWTSGTLSHNLVVVDEQNQSGTPRGSNLELFGLGPGVQMVQASGFGSYDQCEEYRRTCAHIQTPEGGHYIVDFFRVEGGETHQYTFHCNGSLVDLKPAQLAPQPVELSETWSYWVDNPRAVTPTEPVTLTWRYNDVKLDLTMLNTSDTVERIIITDAPGWRHRLEAVEGRDAIQQILAENRAAHDGTVLASRYAAVIVPYTTEASPVMSAQLLENDEQTGAMAVEVQFEGRTDYIISAKDQQQRQYGAVTVAGEFAFVSVDDAGNVLRAYLLAGTHLQHGDTVVELPRATTTLRVDSVSDRTFNLAEALPEELAESAWYVLSEGPQPREEGYPRPRTGFEIETTGADSITVREYPVVECDKVTILHAAWLEANN